jgi:hypothetical protein
MRKFSKSINDLAVLRSARRLFRNPQLKRRQMELWSCDPIKPEPNEVVEYLGTPEVYVAVRREHDKRATRFAAAG